MGSDVDTSAPFESEMEAVTQFGGIGFWKPPTSNQSQASQTDAKKMSDSAKAKNHATKSQNIPVIEERVTLEILEEIEETKTKFEELKVKLQKQEFKVKTHQSCDRNTQNKIDLSTTEILKRVKEATKEVKDCTRVLEEALTRVNGSREKSMGSTMSIGQILRSKLVLAEENSVKNSIKWKVSFGQIMKRGDHGGEKGSAPKRMKFGFCV